MEPLNYTRASGSAFKGLLQSAVPITPAAHEVVNALHELSVSRPSPALDGGSRVWKHQACEASTEWTEVEWQRGGRGR